VANILPLWDNPVWRSGPKRAKFLNPCSTGSLLPDSIEDISLGLDRQGHIEEAHFEFAYAPARGEDGTVEGLFGACIETKARVMAERRQAEDTERQRRLFQCAPGFIAILRGREHVFEFVNEAYVRLLSDRNFVGKTAREAVPEVEDQGRAVFYAKLKLNTFTSSGFSFAALSGRSSRTTSETRSPNPTARG